MEVCMHDDLSRRERLEVAFWLTVVVLAVWGFFA